MRYLRFGKIIIPFFIIALALIPAGSFAKDARVQQHLDKGNELYKSGKYLQAVDEFNAAANLEPENFLAWENLGWSYWRLGKESTAFGIWDNLLKLQPDNINVINRIASIYGNVFEYNKAINLYEKSSSLKPDQKEAPVGIAKVYLKMGEFEKALSQAKDILKKYPDDEGVLQLEAMILEKFSKYDDAVIAWQNLSSMKPSSLEYKLNIANNQLRGGHYEDAVKSAKEILEKYPDDADAIKILAEEATVRKDFSQAEKLFYEAIKRKPQGTDVLNRLSDLAVLNKDYASVIRITTLSLKSDPNQYNARNEYMKRADAYLEENEFGNALNDYKFILNKNPHEVNALAGVFWVYANQGNYPKASQTLKTLEENLPNDEAQGIILRALMDMYSDNNSEAIKVLKNFQDQLKKGTVTALLYHGISKNPDDPEAIFVGDFREQIKMLKEQGYQAITIRDISEHYEQNKPLPQKPLLITFDDADRDSYTYADPILQEFRFKATMFVPIVRVRNRTDVVLSFKELNKMFDSGRWDIQSHGLYAHEEIPVDALASKGDFLANKKWLFSEARLETDQEFYTRLREDYKQSREIIEKEIPGSRVIAYAFPRGNFGQINFTNYPVSIGINLNLLKEFYSFGLYQGKYGATVLSKDNIFIQRYEVTPGVKAQELKNYLHENELNYLSLQYLAESYVGLKQFDKAEQILSQVPDKDKDSQYYVLKGVEFREKGKLRKSEEAFKKALALDKNNEQAKQSLEKISVGLRPTLTSQYLHFSDNHQRIKNKYSMGLSQYITEDINLSTTYERAFFHDKGFGRVRENQANIALSYYPSVDRGIVLDSKTRMFSTNKDVLAYQVFAETAVTNKISASYSFARDSVDTARGILAGIKYYQNRAYIDTQPTKSLSASFRYEHDDFSDTNRKDYTRLLLMERVRNAMPELFVGYAYLWGNSKFNAPQYYSPQNLSINEADFRAVIRKGEIDFTQECVVGYGRDTGVVGVAYTFITSLRYNLRKNLDFFSEFDFDFSPSYHSTQVIGGLEYRF